MTASKILKNANSTTNMERKVWNKAELAAGWPLKISLRNSLAEVEVPLAVCLAAEG